MGNPQYRLGTKHRMDTFAGGDGINMRSEDA